MVRSTDVGSQGRLPGRYPLPGGERKTVHFAVANVGLIGQLGDQRLEEGTAQLHRKRRGNRHDNL